MKNECIYKTTDGGCSKKFICCPNFVTDATDLGCGGVGYEYKPKHKPTLTTSSTSGNRRNWYKNQTRSSDK